MTLTLTRKPENRTHTLLIVAMWAALIVSVALLFSKCFFGVTETQDEGYQALNCLYYGDSPLGMLTFYIGNLAMRIFGNELIVLRSLGCSCLLLSIAIPLIYFYRRTGNALWTLWMAFFLVNFFCHNWMTHLIFSWDTCAYPFLSALVVCLMTYLDRPSGVKAATAGALCAALILARITAVASLPVMILAVIFAYPRSTRRWLRDSGIALLSFMLTAIVLIFIMKGSIAAYIASWSPDNIITGHDIRRESMKFFMASFRHDLTEWSIIASYSCQVLLVAALTMLCCKFWPRRSGLIVGLTLLFFIVMQFLWRGNVTPGVYIVPLTMLAILCVISYCCKGLAKCDGIRLLLIIGFVLVPVVGSDRVFHRFGFFYCLPLLMYMIYRYKSQIFNRFLMLVMAYLMVSVFVYDIYDRIEKLDEGKLVHQDIPHHKLIYDYPHKWAELRDAGDVVQKLRREGVKFAFFGDGRYVMEYSYNSQTPAHIQWFHYFVYEQVAQWVAAYTREQDAVFVHNIDSHSLTLSEVDSLFRANGFVPVKRMNDYTLYMAENDTYSVQKLKTDKR